MEECVHEEEITICSNSGTVTQLTVTELGCFNRLCLIFLSSGTGSFELRGDGSIHEWTIENQTPAGSAKLNQAALDLAVFGVHLQTCSSNTAVLLRTHPPKGYPGNYINYVTTGAIIGDGDRKFWDLREPMIGENFYFLR